MKLSRVSLLIAAGIVAVGIAQASRVVAYYDAVYPSDPGLRDALRTCELRNPTFNQFDAVQRQACYRIELGTPHPQTADDSPAAATGAAAPNFVDLWRAAGEGHLPANDVRSHEQDARYLNRTGGTLTQ